MYRLDLNNRQAIAEIDRPHSMIVAVDDNRVSYDQLKQSCEQNKKYCHFYSFKSGKHLIHLGANKDAFEKLIIELANK